MVEPQDVGEKGFGLTPDGAAVPHVLDAGAPRPAAVFTVAHPRFKVIVAVSVVLALLVVVRVLVGGSGCGCGRLLGSWVCCIALCWLAAPQRSRTIENI